jgi:arylsulfatase A-like enzyme
MPTLLALAGLEVPAGLHGTDLSHAATGRGSGPEPDSAYLMNMGEGWPFRGEWVGFWRGLRTGRWTYARWIRGGPRPEGRAVWLFDNESDPHQTKNLAGDPEHAATERELEARLRRHIAETEDPFETGQRDPRSGMLSTGDGYADAEYWEERGPKG